MAELGITFIIVGVIVFVIGWNSSSRHGKLLLAGVELMGAGTMFGVFGTASRDLPNGSPQMVLVGVILAVLGIYQLVMAFRSIQKQGKANLEANRKAALADFYDECIQDGIKSCESPRDVQKAQLLADRKGLKYPDGIAALYEAARDTKLGLSAEQKMQDLEALRASEQARYAELTRYADLSGREKRIRMLTDARNEALAEAKRLDAGSTALMQSTQQKEHDWALHGGIASGIAGGAAGLATAMDIQAKNAQIRAQNQANLKAMAPVLSAGFHAASDARSRARSLEEAIERTKVKLVDEAPADVVLAKMQFQETKTTISKTGAVTVTTRASGKQTVFDSEGAVADGTIIAKLYQKGQFLGVAQLVLPTYGVGKSPVTLEGICLKGARQGVECTVQFAATNLWAMEE